MNTVSDQEKWLSVSTAGYGQHKSENMCIALNANSHFSGDINPLRNNREFLNCKSSNSHLDSLPQNYRNPQPALSVRVDESDGLQRNLPLQLALKNSMEIQNHQLSEVLQNDSITVSAANDSLSVSTALHNDCIGVYASPSHSTLEMDTSNSQYTYPHHCNSQTSALVYTNVSYPKLSTCESIAPSTWEYTTDDCCRGCHSHFSSHLLTSKNFIRVLRADDNTCDYHRRFIGRIIAGVWHTKQEINQSGV